MKDPSAYVRLAAAEHLPRLDAAEHPSLFELALYDPNPRIARLAKKLAAGKGFRKAVW